MKKVRVNFDAYNIHICASKDPHRPNLGGIHITEGYLEATDGRRLVRVPTVESSDWDCKKGYILPTEDAKNILKMKHHYGINKNVNEIEIYLEGDDITVQSIVNENKTHHMQIDMTYPNTDAIMPDDYRDHKGSIFNVNSVYLADCHKIVNKVSKSNNNCARVYSTNGHGPIIVTSKMAEHPDPKAEVIQLIMPLVD